MSASPGARYLVTIVGVVALAAIAAAALVVVGRQGGSSPAQLQDANQVNECIRTHHMAGFPAQWVPDYTASISKFMQLNANELSVATAGSKLVITAEESCQWPPAEDADATGFSLILLTPVVATRGPSIYAYPNSYADLIDATCPRVALTYERIHEGVYTTLHVEVGRGELADDEGPTFDRIQVSNGTAAKYVHTLDQWASFLDYFISPTESAVVYDEADSPVSAVCES